MTFPRASGILLHPTSLPGPHGIGDLGPEAYRFVDFLHSAGHKLWQVLPLNPTGYADSPFQCFSASAGNPLLLNLDRLAGKGILSAEDLKEIPVWPLETVDYGKVIAFKMPLLKKAAINFLKSAPPHDRRLFEDFCQTNANWLDDFALFMAIKDTQDLVAWTHWPVDIAARTLDALRAGPSVWLLRSERSNTGSLSSPSNGRVFANTQPSATFASSVTFPSTSRTIAPMFGPIANSFGSTTKAIRRKLSGVPPDYFSATGQLWGNPDLQLASAQERPTTSGGLTGSVPQCACMTIIRIDHFRGFEAYWEVPGGDTTATNGQVGQRSRR